MNQKKKKMRKNHKKAKTSKIVEDPLEKIMMKKVEKTPKIEKNPRTWNQLNKIWKKNTKEDAPSKMKKIEKKNLEKIF